MASVSNNKEFNVEKVDIYKKASLVIFGLEDEDRNWILDQLTKPQHDKLKSLLDDLSSLGLEADNTIINEILNNHKTFHEADKSSLDVFSILIEKVDQMSVKEASGLLASENSIAIAMVLSIRNWSWTDKYISTLELEKATEIRGLFSTYLGSMREPIKTAILEYLIQPFHSEVIDDGGEERE